MIDVKNFYGIYDQFLSYFPHSLHGAISIVLVAILIIAIYKVLKRQLVYIILLVILLPASVPILRNIWTQLLEIFQFLLSRK